MDVVLLSRIQFALTSAFHYIFPPMSIGLGLMLVIIEGIYMKTKNPLYKTITKFWVKVFALTFALGVATGLVQVFGFGTNWAHYSRFVGDVFGSALGAEGIFAFFLEAGFLGVMLFGWDRVSERMHYISTILVAFGAHFSAVWIVIANSWMQTPQGFTVIGEGKAARAIVTDFWQMIFNPSSIDRLTHVILGCWLSGIFLVLSVSSYYLIKKTHIPFAKACMKIGLIAGGITLMLQLISADSTARGVAKNQPEKLAAMEGVFETKPYTGLYLFGWVDAATRSVKGVQIPGLLSLLTYRDAKEPVTGLDAFAPEDLPPLQPVFQAYHLMIYSWSGMTLLVMLAIILWWRGRLDKSHWLLWPMVFAVVLPHIANESGWVTAEVGRQPWVVYKVLRTVQGVSEVLSPGQVLASLGMFITIYSFLFAVFIYILNHKIKSGPEDEEQKFKDTEPVYRDLFPDTKKEVGFMQALEFTIYAVIGIAMMMYVVLDGFDLGVGILHLFSKKDHDRRIQLNAIGPVWDGNEVWLVIVVGALFAGFPPVYATLLSSFYNIVMILLLSLIFRAVAIEFRSKQESKRWRSSWDFVFFFASTSIAFLLGVIFGNFVEGIAINENGDFIGSFSDFFSYYSILLGVTTVALFAMHGSIFLLMKTEGALHDHYRRFVNPCILFFVFCYAATTAATMIFMPHMLERLRESPYLFFIALIAMLAIANVPREINKERDGRAFISSCVGIAMLIGLYGIGSYPGMIRSSIDPSFNLTVYNSSSSYLTLKVLFIIVLIGIPFVLGYGFLVYHIFRGKVKLTPASY